MRRWLLAAGLGSGVATVAYWRRALTLDGAVAAAVVGGIVFGRGGWPAAGALLTFFSTSSALSRLGPSRKQRAPLAQAKGARRDAWQVLANGGFATLSLMLGRQRGRAGYLGALAAAGADTWATELGMLASRAPRLITSGQPVAAGTSGGVTPEGLGASLGGALAVGLAWSLLGGGRRGLVVALIAGMCGSLVDSWLGATVQALYRCTACAVLSEEPVHQRCGQRTTLVRGQPWVTNDTVNALSTFSGAIIGAALAGRAGWSQEKVSRERAGRASPGARAGR